MGLLKADGLTIRFGGLTAVKDFRLDMNEGEIVGLIGPNGAGKTTVFNMISGIYRPSENRIYFANQDITGLRPDQIVKKGIARTFQNIRLLNNLSVLDNVMIGFHLHLQSSLASAILRLPGYRKEEKAMVDEAHHLLERLHLGSLADEKAGNLSYGMQRRLEIARALATRPRLLLLDEPAAGMNPQESQELMYFIREIHEEYGLTILLIEHDMKFVMGICHRLQVLDYGTTIACGRPEEIKTNPDVIKAYLGVEMHA